MEKTRNLIGIDILKKNACSNRYSDFSEGWFGSIQSPHLAKHSQYLDRPRLYLALKHAEQSLKKILTLNKFANHSVVFDSDVYIQLQKGLMHRSDSMYSNTCLQHRTCGQEEATGLEIGTN